MLCNAPCEGVLLALHVWSSYVIDKVKEDEMHLLGNSFIQHIYRMTPYRKVMAVTQRKCVIQLCNWSKTKYKTYRIRHHNGQFVLLKMRREGKSGGQWSLRPSDSLCSYCLGKSSRTELHLPLQHSSCIYYLLGAILIPPPSSLSPSVSLLKTPDAVFWD